MVHTDYHWKGFFPSSLPCVSQLHLQAHRLSAPDISQSTAATTTPDDVFYILKLALNRLLSTGSLANVDRVLQQLKEVMDQDYISVLKRKMEDVYRGSGSSGINRGEKAERENRIAFIVSFCAYLLLYADSI